MAEVIWHLGDGWWDTALPKFILAGAGVVKHTVGIENVVPSEDVAVLMIPGRHSQNDYDDLNRCAEKFKKVVFFLYNDEEGVAHSDWLKHPNKRIWWAMPPFAHKQAVDVPLPNGWTTHAPDLIAKAREKFPKRIYDWSFYGQMTHIRRVQCVDALQEVPNGDLMISQGFTQGVPQEKYFEVMVQSKFIPCPAGPCLVPDTLVLKADLTWVRIADLSLGDEIIGFDENPRGIGQGGHTCYRSSKVTALGRALLDCCSIKTNLGTTTASTDHLWLISLRHPDWKSSSSRAWKRTADLQPGDRIVSFGRPWNIDKSWEAGWLAGILDGEGHIAEYRIGIAQNIGPTLTRIQEELTKRGFAFYGRLQKGKNCIHIRVNGGRYEAMRLLGTIRPPRLFEKSRSLWENTRTSYASRIEGESFSIVEAVERVGIKEVVTISTTTKTLVADGLLSHNCTPDSFRFAEALEAGCVPIVDNLIQHAWFPPGYWEYVFGSAHFPFRVVENWRELPQIIATQLPHWKDIAQNSSVWWGLQKKIWIKKMRKEFES